jgi:glycosyltransferase involved in cell wall biosynthesis
MIPQTPLISVCIITFNQENYISGALDSILMQKCSYPFELIIGEDCSTDRTRQICEDYAKKYHEIKLLDSSGNLGMTANFYRTISAATGKYIALCEGDDFWTDPLKLEKQVRFLVQHPEYGMICTDYDTINILNNETRVGFLKTIYGIQKESDIQLEDYIFKRIYIRTLTAAFCRDILTNYNNEIDEAVSLNRAVGDLPLWLYILTKYKVKYWPVSTATYRISPGTASRLTDPNARYEFECSIMDIIEFFIEKTKLPASYSRKLNIYRKIYELEYYTRKGMRGKAIRKFFLLLSQGIIRRKSLSLFWLNITGKELPY